jgi:large subunit ribosomal protein L20
MPRAVSNVPRLKRKKQIMKAAKGAYGARSKLWGPAKETVERAWRYAYRDRKNKKREFRKLWIVRINAAAHQHGMSYSVFMAGMKAAGLEIDRKILADIAVRDPQAFEAIAGQVRQAVENGQQQASAAA